MKLPFFLLLSTIMPYFGFAQNYDFSISASVSKGFILRHSNEIGVAGNSFPVNILVELDKHHYGAENWEVIRKYPDLGLAINYLNYQNEILGSSFGLSPYYKKNIQLNRQFIQFKIGLGLGYHLKPYNRETNHQNQLLGSTLSFSIPLDFQYRFNLTDAFQLVGLVNALHFSNGAIKKPNKGINIISSGIELVIKQINILKEKRYYLKPLPQYPLGIFH